jgi:carboxyl-terminal processing protease
MTFCFPTLRSKPFLLILSLLALSQASLAQTVDGKPEVKAEVIAHMADEISRRAFVPGIDFTRLPGLLEQEKSELDAAKNDEEFARAINSALSKFGASHIVLWTPRTTETRATASTVGIGISSRSTPEGLLIMRVVPGTPASDANLVVGDTILEVDGKKVDGTRGITGPEGSSVQLTVKKEDGQVVNLTLPRRRYSTVHDPEFTWVDRDTAKITLYTFDNTYNYGLIEDFMDKATYAKNLIIDLRDNGGGVISNLQHFLGFMIPSKQAIGTFISKPVVARFVEETHGDPKDLAAVANFATRRLYPNNDRVTIFKGKVIVLINKGSGSASEIAAAALKDTIGAEIIGTKSAGAVLVSTLVPAADGFMIQFPLSDYVTIKGKRLEGTGVTPDLEAKDAQFRLRNAADASLDKALAFIDDLRRAEEASIKG